MTEVKKHSEEFKFHTKLIPIVSQQFSAHTAGTDYYLTLPDTGTHVRAEEGALAAESHVTMFAIRTIPQATQSSTVSLIQNMHTITPIVPNARRPIHMDVFYFAFSRRK